MTVEKQGKKNGNGAGGVGWGCHRALYSPMNAHRHAHATILLTHTHTQRAPSYDDDNDERASERVNTQRAQLHKAHTHTHIAFFSPRDFHLERERERQASTVLCAFACFVLPSRPRSTPLYGR